VRNIISDKLNEQYYSPNKRYFLQFLTFLLTIVLLVLAGAIDVGIFYVKKLI